jgi:hypothetical protein
MYITYGPLHERLRMCTTEVWTPEQLLGVAIRFFPSTRLDFEYDLERYASIQNEHELALACRVVCAHHNEVHARHDDDGWLADTAAIWERMLFLDSDEEESSSEAEDPP